MYLFSTSLCRSSSAGRRGSGTGSHRGVPCVRSGDHCWQHQVWIFCQCCWAGERRQLFSFFFNFLYKYKIFGVDYQNITIICWYHYQNLIIMSSQGSEDKQSGTCIQTVTHAHMHGYKHAHTHTHTHTHCTKCLKYIYEAEFYLRFLFLLLFNCLLDSRKLEPKLKTFILQGL